MYQDIDLNYYLHDTWTEILTPTGFGVATAIAYGGVLNGQSQADVLYVASDSQTPGSVPNIYLRAPGGFLTKTSALPAGAGTIQNITLDPTDWHTAFVTDGTHVYMTTNQGAKWQDITGNLTNPGNATVRTRMAVIAEPGIDALLFAGNQGVSRMLTNNPRVWIRFGANLPNVETTGLVYNVTDDVLVVSTIGRGFWEVKNTSVFAFGNPVLSILGDNPSGNMIDVRLDPANSSLLEVLQNGRVEFEAPTWANPHIEVDLSPNDMLNIEDVPAGVQLVVVGVGSDTVNIHNASQGVQGIQGTVDVATGGMTLNVDDTGDNAVRIIGMGIITSPATSGYINWRASGEIKYEHTTSGWAVANLTVATDAVTGNQIIVQETGVTTYLVVDAATNVFLGDAAVGANAISGDVYISSSEEGNQDKSNVSVTVNDLAGTPGTATVSTFTPLIGGGFFSFPVFDTTWGSISGLVRPRSTMNLPIRKAWQSSIPPANCSSTLSMAALPSPFVTPSISATSPPVPARWEGSNRLSSTATTWATPTECYSATALSSHSHRRPSSIPLRSSGS